MLAKENAECQPGQTWVNDIYNYITLQECIRQAETPGSGCVGNLVEWGKENRSVYPIDYSFQTDPSATGYCICYQEGNECTPDKYRESVGQHLVSYTP